MELKISSFDMKNIEGMGDDSFSVKLYTNSGLYYNAQFISVLVKIYESIFSIFKMVLY